jgi:hypothetical protein
MIFWAEAQESAEIAKKARKDQLSLIMDEFRLKPG